jgi:L-cysteine:1D-myo-inositol 2-amino-2-deoxy-alpha-D-glucopyranoside ligase
MSKSLGNMVFVTDLLKAHSPNALRVYLLRHHYRSVWEWSPSELAEADSAAQRLAASAGSSDTSPNETRAAFAAALADDLDTPRALHVLTAASGGTLRELASVLGLVL